MAGDRSGDRDAAAANPGAAANGSTSSADPAAGMADQAGPGSAVDLAASYRRDNLTGAGNRAAAAPAAQLPTERGSTPAERREARQEEVSLLKDNKIVDSTSDGAARAVPDASEATPLLGEPDGARGTDAADDEAVDRLWEDAVLAGRIKTTWQRETKVLVRSAVPLICSQLLGYTYLLTPVLALGHLGTIELGAMSLGAMTANITGFTIFQSLATALDTLCAQAYGAGQKELVGVHLQRMVCFLLLVFIPVAAVWVSSPWILHWMVPNPESARLAGLFLQIEILGMPGLVLWECGIRFLQAQGIFSAALYANVLLAPANVFLVWFLVWYLQWGFVGAPIASAILHWLRVLVLAVFIYFRADPQCWPGLSRRAFQNWPQMIRLALSGLLMVEAETLALEIVTLLSSYFGTTALAAQSVLTMSASAAWQIAFPLSIAMSNRIANFIGASLVHGARTTAKVGMTMGTVVALFNFMMLTLLRQYVPRIFSSDPAVWEIAATVLPLCAAMSLFDSLATNLNGILRGLGRQKIGGYVNLIVYYAVAMPISLTTAFLAGWQLHGLWTGITIALACITVIESVFIYRTSWDKSVDDARVRNAAG